MKLSTGVAFIAAGAATTAYAAPLQANLHGSYGNSEAVQVQWVPKADLVYQDADSIRLISAFTEYINKILPIDFDVPAVIQGFDGSKYLPYLRTFEMKVVLDILFKNTNLDDVTKMLDTLRKMNLSVFLPIGLNMIAKDPRINGEMLYNLPIFKPFSAEIFLDTFAKMDLTVVAKLLDQPEAIAAFKDMTGVDPKPTIDKLYGMTGADILDNYAKTTGRDFIECLEKSSLFEYFEDYLGIMVRDGAEKIFGNLTGKDVLEWISKQEVDINMSKFANGDFFEVIDENSNRFFNVIRKPWVDGTIQYRDFTPEAVPEYTGYDSVRNLEALSVFLTKIIGFKPMDYAQWVRSLDYAKIKATISSITGVTLSNSLKSALNKIGTERTDEVLKAFVNLAYVMWTSIYELDGDQIIAFLETATGQRIEEVIRGIDFGLLARLAHEAYVHEIVMDLTSVDIEPILLDLAKVDMNTVVDGWASLLPNDFLQMLVDHDLFNYLATYGFNTVALAKAMDGWSGQAFIDWIYAHDGPWYLRTVQTWNGPVVVDMLNELTNRCASLFREMTEGDRYSVPDLPMTGGSASGANPPRVASAAKPAARPEAKPAARPAVAPAASPAVAPVARPAVAPVARPAVAPVARPSVAPVAKPAVAPKFVKPPTH